MQVIEKFEHVILEEDDLMAKMRRISIIESAADELDMSLELHPDTEKELLSIGITPEEFTRQFQATEDGC